MARRRPHEEHENHERWLVSYADFITLLFAFFVVMYSVSSVNEGKMRVLSDTLVARFADREKSLEPIQVGELVRSPVTAPPGEDAAPVMVELPRPVTPSELHGEEGAGAGEAGALGEEAGPPASAAPAGLPGTQADEAPMAGLEAVAQGMEAHVEDLMELGLVDVRRKDRWIEVELNNSILFASGDARLSGDAVPVLAEMAEVLKGFPNPIQVEGFTDDVPISTVAYPSNWELSAARAASVVHLFMKYGVRPDRMVAVGYGQHRAVASNDTAEGRARNRRVVLIISADPDTRRVIDLEREDEAAPATEAGRAAGKAAST